MPGELHRRGTRLPPGGPRAPRGASAAALSALLLLAGCVASPPPPPPPPEPEPIAIGPEGTPPILFEKVILRIPAGTRIGAVYDRDRPSRELRETVYQQKHLVTEEFNIAVTDRMAELGYDAVDPTEAVFSETSSVKARFRLVGVITDMQLDLYESWRKRERNYQKAAIELELRLYDAAVKDVVFERSYPGKGYDKGSRPSALPPAVLDAVEGALADEQFVALVTGARARPSPADELLSLPACPARGLRLPQDIRSVSDAVVTVRLGSLRGSGVVVSGAGHVLTAAHLVEPNARPRVELASGLELEGRVLRFDKVSDLALLELPGGNHQCAPLLGDASAEVGTAVFAIGSPLDDRLSGTVTRGIVSGHPTIEGQELLQTDASINPGNSGGPMLDERGRVIGIVTTKAFGVGLEGIAFGVPVHVVRERLALELP